MIHEALNDVEDTPADEQPAGHDPGRCEYRGRIAPSCAHRQVQRDEYPVRLRPSQVTPRHRDAEVRRQRTSGSVRHEGAARWPAATSRRCCGRAQRQQRARAPVIASRSRMLRRRSRAFAASFRSRSSASSSSSFLAACCRSVLRLGSRPRPYLPVALAGVPVLDLRVLLGAGHEPKERGDDEAQEAGHDDDADADSRADISRVLTQLAGAAVRAWRRDRAKLCATGAPLGCRASAQQFSSSKARIRSSASVTSAPSSPAPRARKAAMYASTSAAISSGATSIISSS